MLRSCFVLVLSGAVLVLALDLGVSRSIAITITSTDKAPPEPVDPRLMGHLRAAALEVPAPAASPWQGQGILAGKETPLRVQLQLVPNAAEVPQSRPGIGGLEDSLSGNPQTRVQDGLP